MVDMVKLTLEHVEILVMLDLERVNQTCIAVEILEVYVVLVEMEVLARMRKEVVEKFGCG